MVAIAGKALVLQLRGGNEGIPEGFHPQFIGAFFHKFLDHDDSSSMWVHPTKLMFSVLLALFLEPTVRLYFDTVSSWWWKKQSESDTPESPRYKYETKVFHVVDTIVGASRIFWMVAGIDLARIVFVQSWIRSPQDVLLESRKVTTVLGFGIYLYWGFRKLSVFKLYLLKKIMKHSDFIENPGRLKIINRLTDCALFVFGFLAFYEVLNVEMGYSAKSLVAIFSFASAVVSFATKDIITNFLNGILLSASDRIYEGDSITFSKKSSFGGVDSKSIQKVDRLGWLETSLRGSDNVLYTVPNTELLNSQISNLSRIKTSQVHQTLHFSYETIDRLPKLLKDIKSQIRKACPSIITDGSRPFRCYFLNFGPKQSHIEVFVDAHFRIPPFGDLYYENRQKCLMAIDEAIRKNNL